MRARVVCDLECPGKPYTSGNCYHVAPFDVGEVFGLHQFFEDWFTGKNTRCDQTFECFLGVLADDFEIVSPKGKTSSREEIAEAVIVAHGGLAEPGFRIWIENFSARPSNEDTWVVTYEE